MPSIGQIRLASPFCQAGLAGYSDRAMRLVARRRGCAYAVTEALLDVILCNGGEGLRKSLDINDEDHPLAGQIIGSDAATMTRAASLLQQGGYDVIDLNYACPVKKIKNKSRGGHMLKDTARGIEILKSVRDALPPEVPTTISLRRAFDDSAEAVEGFFEIVESAWANGYGAVRVHGRTVEQKYTGRSQWPFLADLKRRYPDRTILGSGDVFTAEDAVRMYRQTGVDVVWIARGAIGNPWIFEHARALLNDVGEVPRARGTGVPPVTYDGGLIENSGGTSVPGGGNDCDESRAGGIAPPSIHAQREALREHFAEAMKIHGEQLAGRRMRKMGIKYSRFHPEHARVKVDFISTQSLRDWTRVLDDWYASDGPGIWPDPASADEVNDGQPATC